MDFVRKGVAWIATEHAAPDTHVLGGAWKVFEGDDGSREVRSIIGQPHIWEQVLLYVATLEAYPPADLDFDEDSIGGVLDALRAPSGPGEGVNRVLDRTLPPGIASHAHGSGRTVTGTSNGALSLYKAYTSTAS